MTIAEIARQLGVSRNTIYTKLKDAGIDVDTLKATGNQLTQQGQSVIAALFDGKKETVTAETVTHDSVRTAEAGQKKTDMTESVTREQLETAVRLATAEAEVRALRNENENLKGQIAFLREQLTIAQEQTRRLLPPPRTEGGLFQWLKVLKRHTVTDDTTGTADK